MKNYRNIGIGSQLIKIFLSFTKFYNIDVLEFDLNKSNKKSMRLLTNLGVVPSPRKNIHFLDVRHEEQFK